MQTPTEPARYPDVAQPSGGGRSEKPLLALPARARILVVTLRRIGDVLLTTPLIRSLRRAWPDATLDALVFAGTDRILKGNPDLNRVIATPAGAGARETISLLARVWKRYDLAISTQSGDRPTYYALIAGRTHAGMIEPGRRGVNAVLKRLALHRRAPVNDAVHRVEHLLQIADVLGIERVPEVVCPAEAPFAGRPPGADFAVVHAAPMFRYKQWSAEGWRALARSLAGRGIDVIAISGPDEKERRYLREVWQGVSDVHQAGWAETVWLLARARVYIGPDTAVSHLAAAAGCPTVALFGPMDPRIWGPWPIGGLAKPWLASGTIQNRGNVWVVQNPLPCLPCTFEGCERHIASHSRCLDELAPEQVLAAVDQALAFGQSVPNGRRRTIRLDEATAGRC